jgi:hypothetical protein
MKVGWILVILIWVIPLGSMMACPYDLHGFSGCASIAQFGRTASAYLVAPGLWLGSAISGLLAAGSHAGASYPAFVFGIACWLILLSAFTLYLAKALVRRIGY